MSEEFKTIQSVGREGLIKQISEYESHSNQDTIKGIGDDAAVLKKDGKTATLLSSDTYVEGVHFDITYTPLHHFGYKMISAAVSDIYAMNGTPTSVLVNLALPNRQSAQMVDDLYKGIYAAGFEYEVEVVSAHRTPDKLMSFSAAAADRGIQVIIAGAGGAVGGSLFLWSRDEELNEQETHHDVGGGRRCCSSCEKYLG